MKLFPSPLSTEAEQRLAACGHFVFRVSAGLMIFYNHGLHKLEGGIAYFKRGTPWVLAQEVAGMHFPAPLASAIAATLVQFVCSLFVVVGLFTRLNAALLTCALGGAILQNVLAGRDPQLALLYTLGVVTLTLMADGPFSLDSFLSSKAKKHPQIAATYADS